MQELNPYIVNNFKNITLKTLPVSNEEAWNMLFKYKHPNENLGIVHLKKKDFYYSAPYLYDSIRTFLNEGRTLEYSKILDYYHNNDVKKYQIKSETFSKLHWLLRDFLRQEKFDNPIGALWNPDHSKFNIHPGATRHIIIENFYTLPTVETLCFNTGGKKVKFDTIFNSYSEIQEYFKGRELAIGLSADKGSLIPHIHFNESNNVPTAELHHNILVDFFSNHSLHANFNLEEWGYKDDSIHKKNINIHIDPDHININYEAMAILLATMGEFRKFGPIEITL